MMKAKTGALLAVLLLVLVLVGVALAQPDNLPRSVIGGAGEQVSAGNYVLNGTLGEPVASGLEPGATYGLCSGFWCGSGESHIFIPIILKETH